LNELHQHTCIHASDGVVEDFDSCGPHALGHHGYGFEASLPDPPFWVEEERSHHLDHRVEVERVAGEGEEGEDDEVDDVLAHATVLVVQLGRHHVDDGARRTENKSNIGQGFHNLMVPPRSLLYSFA
jgi:hypothetical protein